MMTKRKLSAAKARLTQERLKELLSYDPETGKWTYLVSRGHLKAGSEAGSVGEDGYRRMTVDGGRYLSSHLAHFYMTGSWPEHEVDHKDVNPRNDRWSNLRPATKSQNGANRAGRRVFKGVFRHYNRFGAQIKINGKAKHLGTRATPEEAYALYVAAANEHFGEFARVA